MSADLDRLIDRCGIANDAVDVAERMEYAAQRGAEYLARPRVVLVDEPRRIVRVLNAPAEARQSPPALISHGTVDVLTHRRSIEPIGRHRPNPDNPLDVDYKLSDTRAGDELIALLRDGIEPTVQLRRWSGGGTDLLTTYDG